MFPSFSAILERLFVCFVSSSWRMATWWGLDDLRNTQGSILRLISIAQSHQLELAPLISCLASEHRWMARRRLEKLAQRLASGTPLLDALEQTPRLIDDQELLSMRFAAQTGTLRTELSSIIQQSTQLMEEDHSVPDQSSSYYVTLSLMSACSVIFFITFVFPTFEKLFREMEIETNSAFQSMRAFGIFFNDYSALFLFAIVVLACIVWWQSPILWLRRSFASNLSRSVADRRSAQIMQLLATASDAGRPLAGALSTLARYHFDLSIRARLLFSRNEIEQGANAWESLATAKLLTQQESSSIASASSSKTRSWLLKQVALGRTERARDRVAFFASFIHPTIILLLGLVVLWLAFATFGSLVTITESLGR